MSPGTKMCRCFGESLSMFKLLSLKTTPESATLIVYTLKVKCLWAIASTIVYTYAVPCIYPYLPIVPGTQK